MNALIGSLQVTGARLPQAYEAAKTALATCQSVDECKGWSDKAAALASYARQAEDIELEQMAARIRARAMRRAGELLKQLDARTGQNLPTTKKDGGVLFSPSQRDVATEAGMSERQVKTAVRIANIPEQEFNEQVESPYPPTITTLAEHGIKRRPVEPETWLQGRDPKTFNTVMHFVGDVKDFAKTVAAADLELIASNLTDDEKRELRDAISVTDRASDVIMTRI